MLTDLPDLTGFRFLNWQLFPPGTAGEDVQKGGVPGIIPGDEEDETKMLGNTDDDNAIHGALGLHGEEFSRFLATAVAMQM